MTQPNPNTGLTPGPVAPQPGASYNPDGNNSSQNIDDSYTTLAYDSPPPMKTLVYSPDVRILIARGNKQYDVSADVVAVSVERLENSVSTCTFRLTNKGKRYTPLFAPMDRIAVFLKRIEWVQVFSGYLDSVPLINLYQGTLDARASCTLKRLVHTWWDPGLPQSAALFDQFSSNVNERDGQEGQLDAGLGSTLRRLLIQVGNWDSTNIHIQRFPTGYYDFMERQVKAYKGTADAVEKFRWMLLGDDTSGGVGPAAGRQLGVTMGAQTFDQATRKLEVIRAVDEMGMGPDTVALGLGQGVGVAATGGTDYRDQEAWKAQQELGKNYAEAAIKNDAAVHAFMVVYAESKWLMYANNAVPESLSFPHDAVGSDHKSVGLFQQQDGWGSVAQRMNARASAGMFLQALKDRNEWRNMDRAQACQNVQRSAFPTGSNYAPFEQIALEEVRALRAGTGAPAGASGQSGVTGGLGTTTIGTAPPPIIAGAGVGSALPGIPTTNGVPTPAAAGTLAGRPQFDSAGAMGFAAAQIGKPYVWAATGPASYDCSGLTQAAYKSIGLQIGRNTHAQYATVEKVPLTNLQPGDLVFNASVEHVAMYIGNNQVIEAQQTGTNIMISPMRSDFVYGGHVPNVEYGGPGVAPFNPLAVGGDGGNVAAPATVAQGSNGGTYATGQQEPIARNLFSYTFEPGRFANPTSALFGGGTGSGGSGSPTEAAFINDEPLMQSVIGICKAGLRNFQSLPNGDFAAYYPDFFGLDGKDAVIDIEDIEMKDVQINWNDDALATHVYVAGSMDPRGDTKGIMGWLNTKGIATVENEWLFSRMTKAAPKVKGAEMISGEEIMRRFGVRPLLQDMSAIQNGAMEFLVAVQIFMQKWAEQYATRVELTFMPELYPGMRINLVGHNLQLYVSAVTHSGDFENGFTTSATLMAPSSTMIEQIKTRVDNALRDDEIARKTTQGAYPQPESEYMS